MSTGANTLSGVSRSRDGSLEKPEDSVFQQHCRDGTPCSFQDTNSSAYSPTTAHTSFRSSSMGCRTPPGTHSLHCFHSIKVLRRIVDGLSMVPRLPPITTTDNASACPTVEWKHKFISPLFKDFIEMYEAQHAFISEWRRASGKGVFVSSPSALAAAVQQESSHMSCGPPCVTSAVDSFPFSRAEVAVWCLTLAYGVYLSASDYSFWAERFLLMTNPSLMLYMTIGLTSSEEQQASFCPSPHSSVLEGTGAEQQGVKEPAAWGTVEREEQGSAHNGKEEKEAVRMAITEEKDGGSPVSLLDSIPIRPSMVDGKHSEGSSGSSHGLVQQPSLFVFPTSMYFASPVPSNLPSEVKIIPVNRLGEQKHEEEGRGLFVREISPSDYPTQKLEANSMVTTPKREESLQKKTHEVSKESSEWETVEEEHYHHSRDEEASQETSKEEKKDTYDDKDLENQYKLLVRCWLPTAEDILANPCASSLSNFSVLSPSFPSSSVVQPFDAPKIQSLSQEQEGEKESQATTVNSNTTAEDGGGEREEAVPLSQALPFNPSATRLNLSPSLPRFSIWRSVKWELKAILPLVEEKPKNFQVWNHRLLLLQHAVKCTREEMIAFAKMDSYSISSTEEVPQGEVQGNLQRRCWGVGQKGERVESEENWNRYLQRYHHSSLSLENDFDDRALIEETLKNEAKNYHAWLYRVEFLRLFPFYLRIPSIEALQDHLGIYSKKESGNVCSSPFPESEKDASESIVMEEEVHSAALFPSSSVSLLPSCPLRTEFDLTEHLIAEDVWNNSAWSHRYCMFHSHLLFPLQQSCRDALLHMMVKAQEEREKAKGRKDADSEESNKGKCTKDGKKAHLEEEVHRMQETVRELCQHEVTYALVELEKDLSNECPLTYARSIAQLFQSFFLRLEVAKSLVFSFFNTDEEEGHEMVTYVRRFIASFSHSLEEALCFVLGSLCMFNMSSSRIKMKAVHSQAQASSVDANVHRGDEEKKNSSYPSYFAGSTADDHEMSWPMISPLPHHWYLSSLVSWSSYWRSYAILFQLYDAIEFSFSRKAEAQEVRFLSLLQQGDENALQEIRSLFKTQMAVDHLSTECESAKYHLLFFFLEQTWNVYFGSMEEANKDGAGSRKEGGEFRYTSPSVMASSRFPRTDVKKQRRTTDYVKDGVTFDMLYPRQMLSKKTFIPKSEKRTVSEDGHGNAGISQEQYNSMLQVYLYVEASALLSAKNLVMKDVIRKKYWRHEVKELLFRRYGNPFGGEDD